MPIVLHFLNTVPLVGLILGGIIVGRLRAGSPLGAHLRAGLGAGGEEQGRVLDEDLDDLVAELDVQDGGHRLLFGSEKERKNKIPAGSVVDPKLFFRIRIPFSAEFWIRIRILLD
jgi:hypothetical protein